MNRNAFFVLLLLILNLRLVAQDCGVSQSLTTTQSTQINSLLSPLDSALKNENLIQIDSLSTVMKAVFSSQGGIPDAVEVYYPLVLNSTWIAKSSASNLANVLISQDSLIYADLWKLAKGMSPPAYQPNSIFLRASAEIAAGLLQIAKYETNASRKLMYESWAIKALDSLATMQLPSGAFPFPDLRMYGDPVFTSVIQNFLNSIGADSVNALQNGWIVDDMGTGEFKFDAGVIANAYYIAYSYTGNVQYKNIVVSIGNYLKGLTFNVNYNYNTFASLGLTRAFQLTNDSSYLERASKTLRFSVFPGQLNNGRWVDGHNANSRYHSIMIQNIAPTVNALPAAFLYQNQVHQMTNLAVKNLVNYTDKCGSATGFRWLIQAYQLPNDVLSANLKDSVANLIGQHINQASINGKYLDVPSIGAYLELLDIVSGIRSIPAIKENVVSVYPNPTNNQLNIAFELIQNENVNISICTITGQIVRDLGSELMASGQLNYQIDLSGLSEGVYFLILEIGETTITKKVVKF